MQIKAIFNTAGGETIRFVPLKVDFTGYEEHDCSNKADSDVVCRLFSISRRWRLAHPALGKLSSSVLVFPADTRIYQNFWHLWFMLYSLWPSNKGRVAHLKSQHRSGWVRSRQPRSFPDMSAAAVNLQLFIWRSGEDEEGEQHAVCKTERRGGAQKHLILCSH